MACCLGSKKGADPRINAQLNHLARNTDDTAAIRRLVTEEDADLLSTNDAPWHHTPLHQACYHGRYEVARELVDLLVSRKKLGTCLEMTSNPCGLPGEGRPVELSRGRGHMPIVKLLEATGRNLHEEGWQLVEDGPPTSGDSWQLVGGGIDPAVGIVTTGVVVEDKKVSEKRNLQSRHIHSPPHHTTHHDISSALVSVVTKCTINFNAMIIGNYCICRDCGFRSLKRRSRLLSVSTRPRTPSTSTGGLRHGLPNGAPTRTSTCVGRATWRSFRTGGATNLLRI